MNTGFLGPAVATVLTACGIETIESQTGMRSTASGVATVLTACGIETKQYYKEKFRNPWMLQQYLPLAVLKPA